MLSLIRRQAGRVWGVLSGVDRVRFRGTVRLLASEAGLASFLAHRRVLFKEFDSRDVRRFLGQLAPSENISLGRDQGEVIPGLVRRPEGVRIKHAAGGNRVTMYDKQGSLLRIEPTINDPRDRKVFRRPEGQPDVRPRWLKLCKVPPTPRRQLPPTAKPSPPWPPP